MPGRVSSGDPTQRRLASYAGGFDLDRLPEDVIHAAKVRLVDTLGVLLGGFSGEPCVIGRAMAAKVRSKEATVIGTRIRTTADMAAFVNGTTLRFLDMNDNYNWPGSAHGHPSDSLAAVLAAAETAGSSGREVLAAIVLAYEVFLRTSDMFRNHSLDTANLTCLASAVAAARLLRLTQPAIEQAIAMAVVPNVILKQVRRGRKSMYKAAATGHAARSGVFAAQLAAAGMEGPDMPFHGECGWNELVALGSFGGEPWGGEGGDYKILASGIKLRPANAGSIAAILAAEEVAPFAKIAAIERITVEVSAYTLRAVGSGEVPWNPDTREIADHSIPYLVATTLLDGTIDVNSFAPHKLKDSTMRGLIRRIAVVENPDFTLAYNSIPVRELARVCVFLDDGSVQVGLSGDGGDSLAAPKSDMQIERKFLSLAVPRLGVERARKALNLLWSAEDLPDLAPILALLEIEQVPSKVGQRP